MQTNQHWLDAGRMLLELRNRVEAEGEDRWVWQKGKFRRSRKDMEKLMRMARADDPEAAFEEEKASNAAQHRKRCSGAEVRSKQPTDVERILPLPPPPTDQGGINHSITSGGISNQTREGGSCRN